MQGQEDNSAEFHNHNQDISGLVNNAINGGLHGNLNDNSTTINNHYYAPQTADDKILNRQHPLTAYIYGDTNTYKNIDELRKQLTYRGIQVTAGGPQGFINEQILQEKDILIIWLDKALKKSTHNLSILHQHYHKYQKPLFILHNSVTPKTLTIYPYEHCFDIKDASPQEINQIAENIFNVSFDKYKEQLFRSEQKEISIALASYPPKFSLENTALFLDWSNVSKSTAGTEEWKEIIWPILNNLRCQLGLIPIEHINLSINAGISYAVALGYIFRSTSNTKFTIQQGNFTWKTEKHDPLAQLLTDIHSVNENKGNDISIELNMTQAYSKINADTDRYIAQHNLTIGPRIQIQPYKSYLDESDAQSIASQIRTIVQQLRIARPQSIVHLFMSIPVGLAVMIGWHLNTLTPIQCYEYDKSNGCYTRSCLIDVKCESIKLS